MIRTTLATLGVAALLALTTTVPANAAPDPLPQVSAAQLQTRITAVLDANPGGTQLNSHTVQWNDGDVTLDLAPTAVGTCATGSFCAYSSPNLTGSKLSYATCSTYSVTAITVRSIANARSSGSIRAQNSGGSTLATVGAGAHLAVAPSGVVKLHCVA